MKRNRLCLLIVLILVLQTMFSTNIFANELHDKGNKIGDTEILELYFNEDDCTFSVVDKRNGYVWCSGVTDYNPDKINKIWAKNLNSLFRMEYADLTKDDIKTKTKYSVKLKPDIKTEPIDNGIKIYFHVEDLKLLLTFEVWIEDDSLNFRIPIDGIKEKIGSEAALAEIKTHLNKYKTIIQNDLDKVSKFRDFKRAIKVVPFLKEDFDLVTQYFEEFVKKIDAIKTVDGLKDKANKAYEHNKVIRGNIKGDENTKGCYERLDEVEQTEQIVNTKECFEEIYQASGEIIQYANQLRKLVAAGIVNFEVLPFLGASEDDENGYVFYPDGCGAISYFTEDHPQYFQYYHKDIYIDDIVDIEKIRIEENKGLENIMLPVWGIKKGDNAVIGICDEGVANACINYFPSGYQVNLNRVSTSYKYRRTYQAADVKKLYQKEIIPVTHTMKYIFLTDDDSDYNGMASCYREYLLDNDKIKKSVDIKDNTILGLDFVLGVKEERILFDKIIKMTTFEEVEEILKDLNSRGVTNMQVNLLGWMKDGYKNYPTKYECENKIGGKKGLDKLTDYTNKNGISLYLEQNYIEADKQNGGFSTWYDVIRKKNTMQITDPFLRWYILNPLKSLDRFTNGFVKSMKDISISGTLFEGLGKHIYYDYNESNSCLREDTVKTWQKIMEQSNKVFGKAAVRGGNSYVLPYADRLMDIPIKSTGYFFTDEDVPFYQMVVHGLIPYSSKPFNLFYDAKEEKLKAIEYGNIPYFQVTKRDSDELKYTDFSELFTSKYDDWKEEIEALYKEFYSRIGNINSSYMIEHEKIKDKLYKVKYSNGSTIYINYNDQQVRIDGYEIQPLDYLVVDREGNER